MTSVDYPVRTPLLYWAVVGALAVLGAVGGAGVAWGLAHGLASPLFQFLGLLIVSLPALYFFATREYRANGVIRLALDGVTVPDPRGDPRRFAIPGLKVVATPVSVRVRINFIPVADFKRGVVLDLSDDAGKRRISTLTLVEPEHQEALLADLERVLRGEPPRGPHATVTFAPARPQSELEAQLDRELAALD